MCQTEAKENVHDVIDFCPQENVRPQSKPFVDKDSVFAKACILFLFLFYKIQTFLESKL